MTKHPPQEVRIIGGRYRRTPLAVPDLPGLRPTPSRVRETLFNWLGQDLTGWRVLDAFSGSGALGLEAASRGAEMVTMLEAHPGLVKHLQSTVQRLGAHHVKVFRANALEWLARCGRENPTGLFDLILLDPPFEQDMFALALQAAQHAVVDGGWLYLEAPERWCAGTDTDATDQPHDTTRTLPPGISVHRHGQAGAVHFHLLRCDRSTPGLAQAAIPA